MARIGKIARLPLEAREELNRRLADGEAGGSLLRWLNELPAAADVLAGNNGGTAIYQAEPERMAQGQFS